MELRVLQYFLAIAREQSIVRAAQSLHLSQPTLSTQIKNLEEELGKQLLIRGTKGSRKVTLTEEGMILRKRAEEILDLVKKTEKEVTLSDDIVMGDIYIGTGETDAVRILARTAKILQNAYPGIRCHISSGNSTFVMERLDKGLLDFGIIFGTVDLKKYNTLRLPSKDVWGVLMRKDSPLASKNKISPEDLWDKPLILSQQEYKGGKIMQWLKLQETDLNIAATYNLIFNASLLVEEGLGYAIGFDKIINTSGNSSLCFRPLTPGLEDEINIIWKKYQIFSKPAEKFIGKLQETLSSNNIKVF
ncbi:LysR family transcriptional regulator [Lactonifactor sp. BIOML-A3]|uniref:LysR family transcriptional regulator n=1 Tax=unclassified Lactonifactor TaxID=2636670 RepID=UPI0012AFAB09|nr:MULTISPECIES: LysR family transcriptional regulator [unclassified Lactonifactor]MSA00921.1 LysR family transcriptional regulator [Lactonifactor sp. BIOML-A5]MSA07715.1 LysR family transcriptional regulator [Lactonifactor sp. BIOML-A4]MSA11911.1 LysR family transcriptional regulator [Lactonifactor sp. BIOML-A3]MSA16351.1 LysR family transcriptional regulator [Lactonifactor sp. BIOML-A2]MSA36955.1 LysR family transcriptional regulator [Lactonifactor sp. BIOML-A1]